MARSCMSIKGKETRFPKKLSKILIPELIKGKGQKYSEKGEWSLWRAKENNLNIWYVIKANSVIMRITPNKIAEYVSEFVVPKYAETKEEERCKT